MHYILYIHTSLVYTTGCSCYCCLEYVDTVEPLNNGHSEDRPLVHYREVGQLLNVCYIQLVAGKQFIRSTEVVLFLECPLSDVLL